MENHTREDLSKLSKDYDLFDRFFVYDRDLLLNELYPPLPVCGNTLIWGFSILQKAGELGMEELITVPVEGSPAEHLALALNLENRKDRFTQGEIGRITEFLVKRNLLDAEEKLSGYIFSSGGFIKQGMQYNSLPFHIRKLVDSRFCDCKTAAGIRDFAEDHVSLLMKLQDILTFAERRQMCLILSELKLGDKMDDSGFSDFLEEVAGEEKPLTALHKIRMPNLTAMETAFQTFREKRLKGTGITLEHPKNFEGTAFQIRFSFRSEKDLLKKSRILRELSGCTDELFSLLF